MASLGVLIIGAGLSGLTAANRLVRGLDGVDPAQVAVIERGLTVGGRLATKRIGRATLDHGAQFFTVRSDEFRREVDEWLAAGVVEEWCRGFGEVDGYPRYRVAGGMNELARYLASDLAGAGVDVATGRRVTAIRPGDQGWRIDDEEADRDGRAGRQQTITDVSALVVTPPVPLALELLEAGGTLLTPDCSSTLDGLAYHRVIALLAVLDRPPDLPAPGALQRPDDPTFTFVADNQAKGISPVPAVTFHTAHARSADLWPADDDEIVEALLPTARQMVAPAEIVELQIERWRYTGPVRSHPDPCLVATVAGVPQPGPLVFAGDGFGGSKLEGAYLSGLAAGAAVTAS
ncbi:MAG: FAD-dependent oxidoreductase [Acidimicrobiia bacterium]|nr:FAD-dependent oxidoreductase [Acidimicrobiia bacterium]